tara:strand:- start:2908 stop:3138 length:231 start_codon:yes stop_codon:yes gene_type:complete
VPQGAGGVVTNADEYAKIRAVNASVTVRVKDDARDEGARERGGNARGAAGSGTRSRGRGEPKRRRARGVRFYESFD